MERSEIASRKDLVICPEANESKRLNHWMFNRIRPYVKSCVLEIGSGEGGISELFIKNGIILTLSDKIEDYCRALAGRYKGNPFVQDIHKIDLSHEYFDETFCNLFGKYDTIFSLNLTEHNCLDYWDVTNIQKLLKKEGVLVLLLPAHTALYRELDLGFKEWHSRNKQHIQKLVTRNMAIIHMHYFSVTGLVRKYLSSTCQPCEDDISHLQSVYRSVVPSFHVEELAYRQIGLSVIAVAKKK